jgi:hypothetical protein
MSVLEWWRSLTGTPSDAVSTWTCPRCGSPVGLTGFGRGRGKGVAVVYRPAVAQVVRACGCEPAGRPAVPEWPALARNPNRRVRP